MIATNFLNIYSISRIKLFQKIKLLFTNLDGSVIYFILGTSYTMFDIYNTSVDKDSLVSIFSSNICNTMGN